MSAKILLDPEPWACYVLTVNGLEFRTRHTRCHESYVYFEPRPEYSQDGEDYPDEAWEDE